MIIYRLDVCTNSEEVGWREKERRERKLKGLRHEIPISNFWPLLLNPNACLYKFHSDSKVNYLEVKTYVPKLY